ncbi:MAG: hypothetical protein GTN97_00930 [Nitrosopumilaceae archaeon]|nr:hypothetical protein [Nitrosopumilaceae archaeon]NIP09339.1 hypothetical protein [Nitrosopumilaceae archaeon]NIS94493.1 hypothetical protein [Nitrosopumilaceae archaeon]
MIVFGVMTGLLLPVRLLFVTYVSDNWLGSFGIISAISIGILILVKKRKLGEFGNMFQRQIDKLLRGKRKIIVYVESAFVLALLGSMIFAINMGNSTYSHFQDDFVITQEIDNPEALAQHTQEWTAEDWVNGFLTVPIAFIVAFPQMSAVIAHIDATLDGWLMHFYTVGFVEYAEFLGILLLYRFVIKTKSKAAVVQ